MNSALNKLIIKIYVLECAISDIFVSLCDFQCSQMRVLVCVYLSVCDEVRVQMTVCV